MHLRSSLIATLTSAAAVHATFAVTFYSGAQCSGSSVQTITVEDSGCETIPADVQSGAGSATIMPDGSDTSDATIVSFYKDSNCGGAPLAEADVGCVTFTDIGVPVAVAVISDPVEGPLRPVSDATASTAVLSFDEAWENGQREAGLAVDPLPEVPEGYKWLTVYMGQWVTVPENTTLRDVIREHGLDTSALQMDINYNQTHECDGTDRPSDCAAADVADFAHFDVAFSSDNNTSALPERQLTTVCSVLYYCYLPFAAIDSGVKIYQSSIAPIIRSTTVTNLWGFANNGYLIAYATHYYFLKTDKQVVASKCSDSDTDKDTIINALVQQLKDAQASTSFYQESLAQCLNTNQNPAPETGSLSLDGWTTRTRKSRCTLQTCT